MSGLKWHNEINDAIMGDRIILEARKIKKIDKPVKGSSKHRAECAEGRHNARAWVDIVIYPTGEFKLSS